MSFDQLDKLLAKHVPKVTFDVIAAAAAAKKTLDLVAQNNETDRVCKLPQIWSYGPAAQESMREALTLPGASWKLRDLQAEALYAAKENAGVLGNLDVGEGKTLVTALLPMVLGAKTTVVLTTKSLQKEFWIEYDKYATQFRVPPRNSIHVVPYTTLQSRTQSDILYKLKPDLIVADEAQHLKNVTSARTKRFLSYMKANPDTRFVPLTGTFFSSSLRDVYHLALLALRFQSPLPNDMTHLTAWANCLDNDREPSPWELAIFHKVQAAVGDYPAYASAKPALRRSFYKRFASAPGVVTTENPTDLPPLFIRKENVPEPPPEVEDALDYILLNGETPDGEEVIVDEDDLARLQGQISCGFIYKWDWESVGGYDEDWVLRRKTWNRALRQELVDNSHDGYDTPFFVGAKLASDIKKSPGLVDKSELHWAYAYWKEVSSRPVPPKCAVWLSDFFMEYMEQELARTKHPTIFWAQSVETQEVLAKRLGIPWYGRGTTIPEAGRGTYSCLVSSNVHTAGVNLQDWSHSYILEPFVSAVKWQQLLGRLHRTGQKHPVHFRVATHTSAFKNRVSNARIAVSYRSEMEGITQKFLTAEWS